MLTPGCPDEIGLPLSLIEVTNVLFTNNTIPGPEIVAPIVNELEHHVLPENSVVGDPLTTFCSTSVAVQVPLENVGFCNSSR